jgi:hypothetical protein
VVGIISVVNKRKYKGDGLYIGRPSPLGNPFSHKDGTKAEFTVHSREEAISKYDEWLNDQYLNNDKIKTIIDKLVQFHIGGRTITFICWCKPAVCHGDAIKDLIISLAKRD